MKIRKITTGILSVCSLFLCGYLANNSVHAQNIQKRMSPAVRLTAKRNQPRHYSQNVGYKDNKINKNNRHNNYNYNHNHNYNRNRKNNGDLNNQQNNQINKLNHHYHYNYRHHMRKPRLHYNKAKYFRKTNYYTYINKPSRHQRGYGIYSAPYGTTAKSFKPITWQRNLTHHQVHIVKEARLNHKTWVDLHAKVDGWMNANGTIRSTRWLKVPLVPQRPQLPTGCEITAVTMMLKYRGDHVNKIRLAEEMPRSSNGNYGFVGSPFSTSGWWIFPHGLMGLVNRYTHHHALNMTGWSLESVKRQIRRNKPVVLWVADMDGFPNHALTIYGYTKRDLMYNDPWLDRRVWLNARVLWLHHSWDALRALSYR